MPCDRNALHNHRWPTVGELIIWHCERSCGFCDREFKQCSHLRAHAKERHSKQFPLLKILPGRSGNAGKFPTDRHQPRKRKEGVRAQQALVSAAGESSRTDYPKQLPLADDTGYMTAHSPHAQGKTSCTAFPCGSHKLPHTCGYSNSPQNYSFEDVTEEIPTRRSEAAPALPVISFVDLFLQNYRPEENGNYRDHEICQGNAFGAASLWNGPENSSAHSRFFDPFGANHQVYYFKGQSYESNGGPSKATTMERDATFNSATEKYFGSSDEECNVHYQQMANDKPSLQCQDASIDHRDPKVPTTTPGSTNFRPPSYKPVRPYRPKPTGSDSLTRTHEASQAPPHQITATKEADHKALPQSNVGSAQLASDQASPEVTAQKQIDLMMTQVQDIFQTARANDVDINKLQSYLDQKVQMVGDKTKMAPNCNNRDT